MFGEILRLRLPSVWLWRQGIPSARCTLGKVALQSFLGARAPAKLIQRFKLKPAIVAGVFVVALYPFTGWQAV